MHGHKVSEECLSEAVQGDRAIDDINQALIGNNHTYQTHIRRVVPPKSN